MSMSMEAQVIYIIQATMNPLLNRLFEDRSKSKSKRLSQHNSVDKALVPKIPTRVKLQSLPETFVDKRKASQKIYLGQLPAINLKTQQLKQSSISRPNFRHRKLSTSIKQMQGNFFSTELDHELMIDYQPQKKMTTKVVSPQPTPRRQEEVKQQNEQQLFQYLKVIQNNQDLNDQFCYMNRRQLPYSFYIVDYEDRNKHEYLTVSLRGITYYQQENNEFYTIRKFTKQIQQFKTLKNIPFFKYYIKMKVLAHWKDKMIRRKFNLKCRYIIVNLFSQNLVVQEYLHFLYNLAEDYSSGNFFNFTINLTQNLKGFAEISEEGSKQFITSLKKFDNLIEKQLNTTLEKLMSKFKVEERVKLKSGDRKEKNQAYLPFDSKRKSMKYTQMAKLKQFQSMLYRLIKYTDMLRFNTKIQLIRRCYLNGIQQLQNLKRAFENKETIRFTNWIYLTVSLQEGQNGSRLNIQPTLESIISTVIGIKQNILKQIFKDHRLFIEKRDSMFCEDIQFDQDEEKPTKFDLKYYILKTNQFQLLDAYFQTSLSIITNQITALLGRYKNVLLKIYHKNIIKTNIEACLDNTSILQYLTTYRQEYNIINNFEQIVEYALVVVKIDQLKEHIRKCAQDKYKLVASAVPNEVVNRCEQIEIDIRNLHSPFKDNPYTVQEYIIFITKYRENVQMMSGIEGRLDKLLQFEEIVYKNGIRIGETAKIAINQCQTYFRELTKRFEEIQSNEENERKKFERMIEEMIPSVEERSQDLIKQIHSDVLVNNISSDMKRVLLRLEDILQSFQKIESRKDELFRYQAELKLGHRQMEAFEKLELSVHYLHQVWREREDYIKLLGLVDTTGYGHVSELNISPLLSFITNSDRYSAVLESYQFLQEFKQEATNLIKIIKISQLLSAETLNQDHLRDLKQIIKSSIINIEHLFTKDGKSKISCMQLFKETNASQIENEISEIVFLSAQQSIVKEQLLQIQEYWKKTKIKFISEDIAQNQILVPHLDANQEIQEKVGFYLIMLKNIEGSPHMIQLARERAAVNGKICNYIREFMELWRAVQKEWIKLLPLMTNCPAVKHQSNVFFQFTSVDTSVRKLIRLIGDMGSIKRLCEDYSEGRYINILKNCEEQLRQINVTFNQFIENKRSTYGRFYFLSDYELIHILEHVKDARTASKHISLCFNCTELDLDNELIAGFKYKLEVFKLRKAILKGEAEEVFKNIEENMKNSMKLNIKTLLPKLKVTPDLINELEEYPLQVILVSDRLFWTEMTEIYLNTTSYPSYKLLFTNICEQMLDLVRRIDRPYWQKLSSRYVQMSSLKEMCLELIRDQITVNDFKWKEQMRMYISEEEIIVNQFEGRLPYGCEYYPQADINIPTLNSTRFLYETYYSCINNRALVVNGEEGQGKRHLVEEAATYFGVYQRQIICNSRLSKHFVAELVQGALLCGAWLTFYEFSSLSYSTLAELLFNVNKANSVQYKTQQYLFMLVHHKPQHEQLSIYGFNHFAVYEPEKQKICEYLLEAYRFRNSEELATKIMKYLKLVKPFLATVMGSQLELIRKVINYAGERRLGGEVGINESALIGEAIRYQIIKKERENKGEVLSKALCSFFDVEHSDTGQEDRYAAKLQTLSKMIRQRVKNIIVLGPRCCKTTLIREALVKCSRGRVDIFGQTSDHFFHSEAMQYLRLVQKDKVVVYDSNEAICQWIDLITSKYLFIDGKKLVLQNQIVMEFRDINNISPSFVDKCSVVYLGQNIINKAEKCRSIFGEDNVNYGSILNSLQDIFGKDLQNINESNLVMLCSVLKTIKQGIPLKNIHKIIIWILSTIDKETLWSRTYGGRHSDFTLSGSQLIPLDPNKVSSIPHPDYLNYLIVPSKTTILLLDSIFLFEQVEKRIHLEGPSQAGKSTLLMLLNKKYCLDSRRNSHEWSESIKSKYTSIRRQSKNVLVDMEKEGHRIVIDDLDLGPITNYQYLRVLIQTSEFRDKHFNQYLIEKFKLVTCSREQERRGKFWSNVCVLSLRQLSKESLEGIYQVNFSNQISNYNMNRQVQLLIQGSIMKTILIIQDDLSNIVENNSSSALLLSLLRNLLSLPKKQAYISAQNYYSFFKTLCIFKLKEVGSLGKHQLQVKSLYENVFKVIFGEAKLEQSEKHIFKEGQLKATPLQQIKQKIQSLYPQVICFDKLVNNVVYLLNQFQFMDNRVMVLGKRGVGKKLILQIFSSISGIPICTDLSQAIIAAIRNDRVILVDSVQKEVTFYEQLYGCESDRDLQKLVAVEMKENFHSRAAGEQSSDCKMLEKSKKIMFALICDNHSYSTLAKRRREILSMPVCYVEQWPPEALLGLYSSGDSHSALHAQIFTLVNRILQKSDSPPLTIKVFEKYLKLYREVYGKLEREMREKVELHQAIHFKFSESWAMVVAWEARVDILKQEMEHTIKLCKDTIMVNQLYSFALSIFYKQIKAEEEKYAVQTEELKGLTTAVEKKIVLMERVLKKIQKIVGSFQRTELGEFKKIYKQNKLIYFGAECLCILLREDHTDEKSINRILADPNLLMRMKAAEVLAHPNPKLEIKFKEFPSLESEVKQNSNELAKTLIEWLKSILEYWETSGELKVEEERQRMMRGELEKSSGRFKGLEEQVRSTKRLMEEKQLIIQENQKVKAEKEDEYNSISMRISNAARIIPILQHEQAQTKVIIEELTQQGYNLRGNAILATFTALYLPLQPLAIKQKLLDMARDQLQRSLIPFSHNFMAEISSEKINSLQSLNYFLICNCSLPKLVIDPTRKFLNYMEANAPLEMLNQILENSQQLQQYEEGKIYHSTVVVNAKENVLIIDWEAVALEEKEAIFINLARFKKPEYFEVKRELEVQINRNLVKVRGMKEGLYGIICERQIRIIDDESFIENGEKLKKLQEETAKLKVQAEEKITQIQLLTESINGEVFKITAALDSLKHFRKVDLALVLDVCRQEGDSTDNLIRWALANLKELQRETFLISLIVALKKENLDILKDVVNETTLKAVESKTKKPQLVSGKHWDVIVRLSPYSSNFRILMESVSRNQLQFEKWCIDPLAHHLPRDFPLPLTFSERWILLAHLKPKIVAYALHKMIPEELPYNLTPLSHKRVIQMADTRFPIVMQERLGAIMRLAKELNESRCRAVRVSGMEGQVEMKRVIWKSMEAGEWLVCYDIQNKRDLRMLEDICYYSMNYDKQPGFRVFIALDTLFTRRQTSLERLLASSPFLLSNCVRLYQQSTSCDSLLHQHAIEYQINQVGKQVSATNKMIFNRMYRLMAITYCVALAKHPELRRLSFRRVVDALQFIKAKNIVVEFNVFTVVQFLSRTASHLLADPARRREVDELWEYIVDESRMSQTVFLGGINLEEEQYDPQLLENYKLIGCNQAYYIRLHRQHYPRTLQFLNRILKLHPSLQEVLAVVRTQLTRTPAPISHKDLPSIFNYYLQEEKKLHNHRVSVVRALLEQLNGPKEPGEQQEIDRVEQIARRMSKALQLRFGSHNIRNELGSAMNRLRKGHEFILYFNPSLPAVLLDPASLTLLPTLLSTLAIHRHHAAATRNAHQWMLSLEFTTLFHEKELPSEGWFISNLQTQEFLYNKESLTIDPSLEVDGIEPAPLLKISLKEEEAAEGKKEVEDLEVAVEGAEVEVTVQYRAVFVEWGLREAKFLLPAGSQASL